MGDTAAIDANRHPSLLAVEAAGTETGPEANLKRLHVLTIESTNGGTTTQNALLVYDLGGGGGGTGGAADTVTAHQGNSTVTSQAWPVQNVSALSIGSGNVGISSIPAVEIGTMVSHEVALNAPVTVDGSTLTAHQGASAATSQAWPVQQVSPVSIGSGDVGISSIPAVEVATMVTHEVALNAPVTVNGSTLTVHQGDSAATSQCWPVQIVSKAVSASQTGEWTAKVSAASGTNTVTGTVSPVATANISTASASTATTVTVMSPSPSSAVSIKGLWAANGGDSDVEVYYRWKDSTATQMFRNRKLIAVGGHYAYNLLGANVTHASGTGNVLEAVIGNDPSGTVDINILYEEG